MTAPQPIRVDTEIDTGLAIDRPSPNVAAYRAGLSIGQGMASGMVSRDEQPIDVEYRLIDNPKALPAPRDVLP